jgi:hypothetical protein
MGIIEYRQKRTCFMSRKGEKKRIGIKEWYYNRERSIIREFGEVSCYLIIIGRNSFPVMI